MNLSKSEAASDHPFDRGAGAISNNVLERVSDAIMAVDKSWRVTYINANAAQLARRRPEDLIGKSIWTEFPEAVGEPFFHACHRAMAEQTFVFVEVYFPPRELWFENRIYPTPDGLSIFYHDITERKRTAALLDGQNQILDLIASGVPLATALDSLLRLIERQSPVMLCSVLLLDDDGIHVRHGAAPSLPREFLRAIDGQPIGPSAGSCGTAAFRREPVIVADIATDPLWENYRDAALAHGLGACWSTPIFDAKNRLLGTFAIYYRRPARPIERHRDLIAIATHIATVAIVRQRQDGAVREQARMLDLIRILVRDPEARILSWSEASTAFYGFTAEEAMGQKAHDLLRTQFPVPLAAVEKTLQETGRWEGELVHTRRDGREVTVASTWVLVRDAAGRPTRVIEINNDISARKQAEAALRESEKKFRALFELASVGIARVAPDGRWLEINPHLCDIVGYSRDELRQMTFQDITHPDDLQADLAQVGQLVAGTITTYAMDKRYVRKGGAVVWINLSVSLVRDEAGAPAYFVSVVSDISERKRAVEALRRSEERLRLALDAAHLGTFDWEMPENHLVWSPEHETMWGYKPGEFGGTYESFAARVHPEDLSGISAEIARCLAARAAFEWEFRVVWPDGGVHWIFGRGEFVFFEDGRPWRMRGAVLDITDRKVAEAEMAEQLHELQRWQKITLGREARVQELKSEVNRLLAQLHQPPRYPSALPAAAEESQPC